MQKHVDMATEVEAMADGMVQLSFDLASVNVPSEDLQNQEVRFVAQDTKSEDMAAKQQPVSLSIPAPSRSIELIKPKDVKF